MHFTGTWTIKCSDLEPVQQQHSFTKAEIKRLWRSERFRSQSCSLPALVPGLICAFLLTQSVSDSSQSAPTDLFCLKKRKKKKKTHWWLSVFCFGKHSLGEIVVADPTPPAAEAISSLTKTESGVWTVCQTWGLAFSLFLKKLCLRGERGRKTSEPLELLTGILKMDLCAVFSPLQYNEWWVLIKKAFG